MIILDIQDYFLSPESSAYVPDSEFILPNIIKLASLFNSLNRPVFLTRHLNTSDNTGLMSRWWKKTISSKLPESKINPEIIKKIKPTEIIEKSQYDAFYQTNLLQLLQSSQSVQTVITGVMTHLCCETTARSAFVNGFEVLFVMDGNATYNRYYHEASLLNLSHGFAQLTFCRDLIQAAM